MLVVGDLLLVRPCAAIGVAWSPTETWLSRTGTRPGAPATNNQQPVTVYFALRPKPARRLELAGV